MLQQTRVAVVVEYYERFLRAFPDIKALAGADEQAVLAQWSGLGYYRRGRMLHAAAKQLAAKNKQMPRSAEDLRELSGIGRYTAAAIASIAFGEPSAVVDGNVERVLLRMLGKDKTGSVDFWPRAQVLIDADRPGDFNQAMMELGATVCLPKNPACKACPIRRWCVTRGEHKTSKPPVRRTAKISYVIAVRGGNIALTQRPQTARLMPGMWELPQVARVPRTKPLFTLRHSITTTDYVVSIWRGRPSKGSVQSNVTQAAKLPLTGLTRKILQRLSLLQS